MPPRCPLVEFLALGLPGLRHSGVTVDQPSGVGGGILSGVPGAGAREEASGSTAKPQGKE